MKSVVKQGFTLPLLISIIVLGLLTACGGAKPTPAAAPTEAAPEATTPPVVAEATTAPEATAVEATIAPTEAAAVEATTAPTEAAAAPANVSFSQHVAPILEKHCLKCHGGERTKEGFDVNSYDTLMAGSDNGEMITPGNSAKSDFITLIEKGKMPPRKEPRLTPEEIKVLTDWVNAGAENN